jgi:hypothetical protein
MEEEEIVRGAQALAAVVRVLLTYLGLVLVLLVASRLKILHVPVPAASRVGSALLLAVPLTLGVEALMAVLSRLRQH